VDLYEFTIKGSTFSGLLGSYELSRPLFEQLNVRDDDLVDVYGEYTVQWDGDFPLVMIDFCIAKNFDAEVDCNSYVRDYIKDLIQETISNAWNQEARAIDSEMAYYESNSDNVYYLDEDED
jgi:hypothetical protein